MRNYEVQAAPGALSQVLAAREEGAPNLNFPPMLLQYWHVMLRWRWLMIGIVIGCVVAAIISTLLVAPKYSAKVQLEISRQQKQIAKVDGLEDAEAGMDLEFYATQYALLKTRPVAERVASDLKLVDSQDFYAANGMDMPASKPRTSAQTQARLKNVVDVLLSNVQIDPIRSSRLVDVTYTSRSPATSYAIANKWAEAFKAMSIDRKFASTADARQFLEQRLSALRQRLEDSERQAVLYASENNIVELDNVRSAEGKSIGGRTLTGTTLEQLAGALTEATAARITAEARASTHGDVASETITSPALAGLRQQRAQIVAEEAKLAVQFDSGYPRLRELAAQIQSVDTIIARETGRLTQVRNREYQEAVGRENALRQKVNLLKGELTQQSRNNIQFNIYQRDADTNRQLYDALLQRYKEIGVAGTVGASNIAIVEPAIVPESPSSPKMLINIALAFVVGLALAAATAFCLEQIDEGVREASQVEMLLKLPLLGVSPVADRDFIEEMRDPKSHTFDAYFSICTSLSFTTSHGFPKSLAVISTRPAEGKSWTSSAIALSLGRTGKRVLLVDGDLRSPSIHSRIGLANERGLSNYLAGDDDLTGIIIETDFKNVSAMTTGPVPPSAAELLSGSRLKEFVAKALDSFDHVIVDSPPVLGMTDAPSIAQAVEGIVYVVESGGPAVRGIRASVNRLLQVNAHIFGVVLTKVRHKQGYGYGYGYGYGERYGEKTAA